MCLYCPSGGCECACIVPVVAVSVPVLSLWWVRVRFSVVPVLGWIRMCLFVVPVVSECVCVLSLWLV